MIGFCKISRHRYGPVVIAYCLAWAAFFAGSQASAQDYVIETVHIPMMAAGPSGLEALLVRLAGHQRFPLALINHGSPRDRAARAAMTASEMQPILVEFARRGWAAVTVLRRGYGASGGDWAENYGACEHPDYIRAGEAAEADLEAAIAALSLRPDIDPTRIISVGISAGGFASTALSAHAPKGLLAAINFAGGRGSRSADHVCDPAALVEAFRHFGARSRLPMLWVYAENDHYFGPRLVDEMEHAFVAAGGHVDFKPIGAFGKEGHVVFSWDGRSVWTPLVDTFLKQQGLQMRERLAALPEHAQLRPPPRLNSGGLHAFETYLAAAPHKAFVIGRDGTYAWRTARRTPDEAQRDATLNCERAGGVECRLYARDDAYAPDAH